MEGLQYWFIYLVGSFRHCCGHIGDRQKPGAGRQYRSLFDKTPKGLYVATIDIFTHHKSFDKPVRHHSSMSTPQQYLFSHNILSILYDVMMYFWMLWCFLTTFHTFDVMMYFLRHDVLSVLCDLMTYLTYFCALFDLMAYFWHNLLSVCFDVITYFWHYDVLLTLWHTFHTFWCHDVRFGIMTVFDTMTYLFTYVWRYDGCNGVIVDAMTYFLYHGGLSILFDEMINCLTSWRTFWRCYVLVDVMTYLLMLWCMSTFHTFVYVLTYFICPLLIIFVMVFTNVVIFCRGNHQ